MEEKSIVLQTPRLTLRRMTPEDFDALCTILQDERVMYAYEGAFDDAQVEQWLANQLRATGRNKWACGWWSCGKAAR